jgi:hypothetical protein
VAFFTEDFPNGHKKNRNEKNCQYRCRYNAAQNTSAQPSPAGSACARAYGHRQNTEAEC